MAIATTAVGHIGRSHGATGVARYGGMVPRKPPEPLQPSLTASLPTEAIGERVRRYRRRLRMPPDGHVMTQPELGALIGAEKGYVARIELGQVAQPGRDVLGRLAKALQVKIRDLDPDYYADEQPDDPTTWIVGMRSDSTLDDQTKTIIEQVLELGRKS